MKKIITLALTLGMFFIACNDSSESAPDPASKDLSSNADYSKGLKMIAGSDCLTCHQVDERINGPSYREVANKYAGTSDTVISYLAGKIISGGSGVWGPVMMTPHPDMPKEDAEAMVKYILLLKK